MTDKTREAFLEQCRLLGATDEHIGHVRLGYEAATAAADAKYLPLAESWLRYKQDMRPETRNDYLRASSRVFALALAAFKSVGV
jgi:hypothetical protein